MSDNVQQEPQTATITQTVPPLNVISNGSNTAQVPPSIVMSNGSNTAQVSTGQNGTQQQQQPALDNKLNSYETIIEQQAKQIEALINQTNQLNGQIVQLINGGAQVNQQAQQAQQAQPATPMQALNNPSLAGEDDYSLEALAKEIGKR